MQHMSAMPVAASARFSARTFSACRARLSRRARCAAQPSKNGSSDPSDGLVINVKPHSTPYAHQSRQPADSASSSVAQRITAPSSAESAVSHTHSKGTMTALGKKAHNHAAPLATPKPPTRLPAWKTATHTADENRALRNTTAKNDGRVKIPNARKMPATSNG